MARTDADTPPTAPITPVTDVVTGLNLSPEILRLAHWRKLPPLPVPAVPAFDLENCCERLGKTRRVEYSAADWSQAGLRWGMSVAEARFWVAAGGRWCGKSHETNAHIVSAARKVPAPDAADLDWVRAQFAERQRELPAELAVPLATLLGPVRLLELLVDGLFLPTAGTHSWYLKHDIPLYRGFWEHVLPYFDSAELDPVREAVRPKLGPETWPKNHYDGTPRHFFVAGLLGMSGELEDLVRTWPVLGPKDPNPYHVTGNNPLLVLYGLSSPTRIESVARNLGLQSHVMPFQNPFELRGWLATTGVSGLDFAAAKIQQKDAAWNGALAAELCRVTDPAAAPHILGLKLNGQYPAVARQWLTRNVGSAVAGLLTTAAGRGRIAAAAAEYLRDLTKTGFAWVIDRELPSATPEVAARLRRAVLEKPERRSEPLTAETEPAWFAAAFRAAADSRSPLPDWLNPSTLPPILVDGRRVADEKVAVLLREIKGTAADATPHLASTLAAGADAGTCDRFAAALFDRWIAEKNQTSDGWVLTAVAWLGGDGTVAAVVPKLKRWPGGASPKRIKEGLKAIRRIGTPYALAQLASLATAAGNNRLRHHANHELTAAAAERRLGIEQLEDRTIPTLGLDDPSSAEAALDYGPRQFRAAVAPDLRLLARDDRGKAFLVLPTPRKSDDAVKVGEARAAWKLAKKQFDLVMAGVCKRMEQALVAQRRWAADEFDAHLVRHPISGAVVRRLLWGRFDPATRRLAETFRVSDEGEYVDADDRPLPGHGLPVGLVHPAHLDPVARAAWAERLADYEIVPPFPQLARAVVVLTDAEREATDFTRFNCKTLNRWAIDGVRAFARWTWEHQAVTRAFAGQGVKAVARMQGNQPMALLGVSFKANAAAVRTAPPEPFHRLGTVEPVALSEALADVQGWAGAQPT